MRALIYRHRYRAFSASVWVHFSDRRRETGNKRSTEGGWRERRRRRDSLDARLKVQRSLVVGLPTRIADRGASCRIQVRTAKRAENRLWTFPPSRWLMSRFETRSMLVQAELSSLTRKMDRGECLGENMVFRDDQSRGNDRFGNF